MRTGAKTLALFLGLFARQPASVLAAPMPPPYEGAYQPRGVDEIGMWREDDESERRLAASSLVIRDEKLSSYVRKVLCDTVGEDRCSATRIYIMRDPTFNASMSPNGTLRIFSGLFLRVHSEAELAAVLGHEFGHFERRHTLEHFKSSRTGTDILAWGAVLAGISATYSTRNSYRDLELSIYGSLYRNERNQEREADLLGVSYLNKSTLRPQAAAQVWKNVIAEIEASTSVKGLKKPNFSAIAFTASHPPNAERAAYLSELALADGAARGDRSAQYKAALAEWLPQFLEDQIKLNDFGASEYIINSLGEGGWTASLWFARGELYRNRGNQRDHVNAIDFYMKSIAMGGVKPDAYRGLGLSLLKTGRPVEGVSALRRYLELKTDATDAAMIRAMLPIEAKIN